MKNDFIGFRVDEELKGKLMKQADSKGKNLSEYIIEVLSKASTN
jgi:predicted HicB family RNase H-like nuclease